MTNNNAQRKLEELRKQIDEIDSDIVQSIARRLVVVEEIGEVKAESGLAVQDANREAKLYVKLNTLAHEHGVPLDLIMHIYDYIISQARDRQQQ